MTDLQPIPPPSPLAAIADVFRGALAPSSRAAYDAALLAVARLDGLDSPAALLERICGMEPTAGKVYVLSLREKLVESGASPATINLRLAALRRVLQVALDCGAISWTVRIPKVKARPQENRKGPTEAEFTTLLRTATHPIDLAVLRLAGDAGLRIGEILSVRMRDVVQDATGAITAVLVKAKGMEAGREPVPIHPETAHAVAAILTADGDARLIPLCARVIHGRLARLGRRAGISNPLSAHRLRHRAGSQAARVTGGDTVATAAFLRHRSPQTAFAHYIDDKAEKAKATGAAVEAPAIELSE